MLRTAKIVDWSEEDWTFAFLSDAIPSDIYRDLVAGLESVDWREASTSFYSQREANLATNEYYRQTLSPARLEAICAMVEDFFGCPLEHKIEVAAHKLITGDQIGIHTDRNSLGETHRLTIHLNPDWDQAQGGVLLALRDRDISTVTHAWLPYANTAFLFEIGPRSLHAVTKVEGVTPRYSIVFTFRARQPKSLGAVPISRRLPFPLLSQIGTATLASQSLGVGVNWLNGGFRSATREEIDVLASQYGSTPDETHPSPEGPLCPIIAVQQSDGRLVVVDGAARLPQAFRAPDTVRMVVFRQPDR